MVKITNGKNTYAVTKGAFDGIYSKQGYEIIKEDKKVEGTPESEAEKAVSQLAASEDEAFVTEMYEKPVSKWTKEDTKRFAELNGVDISGTKNLEEAKALLREKLEF